MSGYQEIVTDPSYAGQLVCLTVSEVGNVGCNPDDVESDRAGAEGLIVRSLSPVVSNWRATQSLPEFLAERGIPGICEIDTRALTRHLREQGCVVGTLSTERTDEDALVQILTEPKNALVKQYQRLFEMEDVHLTFAEDALRGISRKAIERKTGARGLRSIMEGILLDTMFELPGLKGVEEVVISPEVVEGSARPLRIYSERADEIESTA